MSTTAYSAVVQVISVRNPVSRLPRADCSDQHAAVQHCGPRRHETPERAWCNGPIGPLSIVELLYGPSAMLTPSRISHGQDAGICLRRPNRSGLTDSPRGKRFKQYEYHVPYKLNLNDDSWSCAHARATCRYLELAHIHILYMYWHNGQCTMPMTYERSRARRVRTQIIH